MCQQGSIAVIYGDGGGGGGAGFALAGGGVAGPPDQGGSGAWPVSGGRAGYGWLVIWAVPVLLAMMVFPGAWAWYVTRRQLAATTVARQRRLLRQAIAVSAGIGVAILAAGAAAFVLSGYDWPVLALMWALGLLHLTLLARTVRRLRTRTRAGAKP